MVITWKGKKATVKSAHGETCYTLVKVKGIDSMSLHNASGATIKAGLQSVEHAKEWLDNYLKGLK